MNTSKNNKIMLKIQTIIYKRKTSHTQKKIYVELNSILKEYYWFYQVIYSFISP